MLFLSIQAFQKIRTKLLSKESIINNQGRLDNKNSKIQKYK